MLIVGMELVRNLDAPIVEMDALGLVEVEAVRTDILGLLVGVPRVLNHRAETTDRLSTIAYFALIAARTADHPFRQRRLELVRAIGIVGPIQRTQSKAFAQPRHQLRFRCRGLVPLLLGPSRCRSDSPRSGGRTRRLPAGWRLRHQNGRVLQLNVNEGRGLLCLQRFASIRIRPRLGSRSPVA